MWLIPMSHTLSESPWPEVSGLLQTKCDDQYQDERKPENGSRALPNGPIFMTYTKRSEIFKGHQKSNLGRIVELGSNRAN